MSTPIRAAFAVLAAMLPWPAAAQAYPTKPVRFLVGYPPGGGSDIMARSVSTRLAEALGQQVIVDNRPGASANLAAEIAARATPDGHTILMISTSHAISKPLYKRLGYDLEKDFVPVGEIATVPFVVVVHAPMAARTLKDVLATAKDQPGRLSFSSSGDGSSDHIAGELLRMLGKVDLTHVPYKGGNPATMAVISGEVQIGFSSAPVGVPQVKSGRLRAVAVTGDKRMGVLPDVPTVAEAGVPGYSITNWYGVVAPRGSAREPVNRLNAELNRIVSIAEVRERFAGLGAEPSAGTPARFGDLIRAEVLKYTKVVSDARLQQQ